MAGQLCSIADEHDVKVFVMRGFTSRTSLYETAKHFDAIRRTGRTVYVYHFGDHDPSGCRIESAAVHTLRTVFHADFEIVRAAVTPEQIESMHLPTRPTKRAGNSHAAGFVGDSVEVDAIPMHALRGLVEGCILPHLDQAQWNRNAEQERQERAWIHSVVESFHTNGEEP